MIPPFLSVFILVASLALVALADDFKTIDGKEFKNAKVSSVEPDGILLMTKSGISKVYFVELPKEVQERFHYDAARASEFTTLQEAAIAESNAAIAAQQQEVAQERQRQAEAIAQQQQQAEEQRRQADAVTVRHQQQQAQARHRHANQKPQKATAQQAPEQERLRQIAGAAASRRAQEDQRIQREYQQSAEKMFQETALWNQKQRVEWGAPARKSSELQFRTRTTKAATGPPTLGDR